MATYVRILHSTLGIWRGSVDPIELPSGLLAEELAPGHLQPLDEWPEVYDVPTSSYAMLRVDDEELRERLVGAVMES